MYRAKKLIGILSVSVLSLGIVGCGNSKNLNAVGSEVGTSTESTVEVSSSSVEMIEERTSESVDESAVSEDSSERLLEEKSETDSSETSKNAEEAEKEEAFYVEAIPGITEDFIRGVDVSSVLVEENSGVVYYNEAGDEQDIFTTLAEAGVNYVRLRIWNDPYDEDGNGYGGGNNDVATAITLGKRATDNGLQVCIDFHYSDFWADPKRQLTPKAWEGMSVDEKAEALSDYTTESLKQLLDAGVDVTMVQIGNEINNGMSGEVTRPNVQTLLAAGGRAVRAVADEYAREIDIVVHYTNINEPNKVINLVTGLSNSDVEFDIIGLSYYPYWHSDFDNLKRVIGEIQEISGKEVVIAETAYPYTSVDGDGTGNSYSGKTDAVDGYPISVQGQANLVRDVCAAAVETEALGVFYWEPAWIPVGSKTEKLSLIWEEYGSGWASSYATDYDPDDAGKYYGGCSWDNQAMFDWEGHPLQSLNVWKYLESGYSEE